ncbi:hypothetical protein DL95DRAFT_460863 [Leptodontidium sp. 2 PMI_412]|nr:hypothetical protein DL95DRAFT_460863 [Leptodontidium sp. 2 PMI_412]
MKSRNPDNALFELGHSTQVCRWVPGITDIHVVADGLAAPNGKIAYTTDAAQNSTAPTASKTIYAYEVVMSESGPLLATRRTFAMPSVGIPDWIKTDKTGNVYAGCGDGVNVCNDFRMKNPQGKLLGKILVTGGVADLALDQNGMVFIFNDKLFLETLSGATTSIGSKSAAFGITSDFRV